MIGNEGIIDDDTLDASCNDILNNADADNGKVVDDSIKISAHQLQQQHQ